MSLTIALLAAPLTTHANGWIVEAAFDVKPTAVALSPNARLAAAVTHRGEAFLWEVPSGRLLWTTGIPGQQDHGLAFSPDGARLLVFGRWGKVRLLDAATGVRAREFDLRGESVLDATFGPEPGQVTILTEHGELSAWDVETGRNVGLVARKTPGVVDGALAEDGSVAGVVDWDDAAAIWRNVENEGLPLSLRGHSKPPRWVVFSEDGTVAVTSGYDGTAMAWETSTGRKLWHCGVHPFFARALAVSVAAGRVIVEPAVGPAVLLDLHDGDSMAYGDWSPRGVRAAAFSSDGELLLTAGVDGRLFVTRVEDGVVIQSLGGGASAVEGLGTSPDGSTLHVTDCWDRTWNWDLAAHGVPETIGAGVRSPLRVPSPDGRTVLVRGDSPTFVRRSAADDTVVQSYVGHRGWIRAVIFIDETLIASASGDGTVRLWDVGSGETLAILISNPGERWAVLAPDGRYDVGGGGLIDSVSWLAGEVTWPVADLDPSKHVPGLLPRILAEHRSAMDRR